MAEIVGQGLQAPDQIVVRQRFGHHYEARDGMLGMGMVMGVDLGVGVGALALGGCVLVLVSMALLMRIAVLWITDAGNRIALNIFI